MRKKPLLITDCDEVLLYMWRPFADWLLEIHTIVLEPQEGESGLRMRWQGQGQWLEETEVWRLFDGFFPDEMPRQMPAAHMREALTALERQADIVILTNLPEDYHAARIAQLAGHGIHHRLVCNQGGKGEPVARLRAEFGNPVTVFIDDRPSHHESVALSAPEVHRLHMVVEPELASHIAPATHAHARIDDWREAERWIAARFAAGTDAAPTLMMEI